MERNLPLDIQPLTPDLADDYFEFFDNAAFADHMEWSWCYCTFYHFDQEVEAEIERSGGGKDAIRAKAAQYIQEGKLRGYLAYHEGRVIAWCNANDRCAFARLRAQEELGIAGDDSRALSIVYFIVAAPYRRIGVAGRLLRRVLADAALAGYDYVESYPVAGEADCFTHYHGHREMYEKAGFALYESHDGYDALRFSLDGVRKYMWTERLFLRLPITHDAQEIQRLAGDWAVAKTTLGLPHPYQDGMAEAFITRCAERFSNGTEYTYVIADQSTDLPLGCISIFPHASMRNGEIGYWVGKPHWGQGYATEALRRLIRMAFDNMGYQRVYAYHMPHNPASGKVMEKAGMQYEGTLRQAALTRDGAFSDLALWAIVRDDYAFMKEKELADK